MAQEPHNGTPIAIEGAGGITLRAERFGPSDGMAIILSHGGGQTRHAWGGTAAMLADSGFQVVSVDLRGHGESDWVAPGTRYDIGDYAQDIRLVQRALGVSVVLVGASLGGIASLYAAGEAPSLPIAGLCLVDVSYRMKPEGTAGILGFMRSTSDGFATLDDAADAIASYLPHRPRPTNLEGLAKNLRCGEDNRYRWHWDPRTIDPPLDPQETTKRMVEAAAHVAAPALLLRGEHSEIVDKATAREFMELFPHGHTRDIPGARHMISGDRNDLFGDALHTFVTSIRDAKAL